MKKEGEGEVVEGEVVEGEGAGREGGGEVTYARSQRFPSVRVCFEKHGDRLKKKKPFFLSSSLVPYPSSSRWRGTRKRFKS